MKEKQGFASMTPEKIREIASKEGLTAQSRGTAHRWTPEEARAAGQKGGNAPHISRGRQRRI